MGVDKSITPPRGKTGSQAGYPARWEWAFVGILIALLIGFNAIWISLNDFPPYEHSCRNLQESAVAWQRWSKGCFFEPNFYPDGAYVTAVAAYAVAGFSLQAAQYSMLFYLLPIVLSCWWMGRRWAGPWGGLLAALAAGANPWLHTYLHGYILEIPLLAWVSVSWALALESGGGKRPYPTLGLGLCLAGGMLVKWSYAFFMVPCWLWLLWRAGRERRGWQVGVGCALFALLFWVSAKITYALALQHSSWLFSCDNGYYACALEPGFMLALLWLGWSAHYLRRYRREGWSVAVNIALAAAIGVAGAGWWYYLDAPYLLNRAASDLSQGAASSGLYVLLMPLLSALAGAPLWLAGAVAAGWRRERTAVLLALAGLFFPILAYMCVGVPACSRYLFPASAAVALSAAPWGRLPRLRYALAALLVLALAGNLGAMFWGSAPASCDASTPQLGGPRWCQWALCAVPPRRDDTDLGEFTAAVQSALRQAGDTEVVGLVTSARSVDVDTLMLAANRRGRTLYIWRYMASMGGLEDSGDSLICACGVQEGALRAEFPFLSSCRLLKKYSHASLGDWLLFARPQRREGEYVRPAYAWTNGAIAEELR